MAKQGSSSPGRGNIRVLSWNVNGIRAIAKKGFDAWLGSCGAEIVGVQESRATAEQLPPAITELEDWHRTLVAAKRLGYSGVTTFSRRAPDKAESSLGEARFDDEGRFACTRYGRLFVFNVYFPNGNGKDRDNSRVPYKLDFTRRVLELAERKRRGGYRVLVMGDFNTAREAIDLARPKQNAKTSGFLPEERASLDEWVDAGWVDSFRHFEPEGGHYTWWSQRGTARERNVGWRIDYVMASPNLRPFLKRAFHLPKVMGSDHCPLGVDLDASVFK
jgi:exodeoxyribonuclease-3